MTDRSDDMSDRPTRIVHAEAEVRFLRAEVERLREGLRRFGIHAETCPRHRLFDECTCGLADLLDITALPANTEDR